MKKLISLLLTTLVLFSCLSMCAMAEEPSLYALYSRLLGDREITLTVTSENVTGLEEALAPYGTVVCSAKQEDGKILLSVTSNGAALAAGEADETGIRVESPLLGIAPTVLSWEALNPRLTLSKEDASVLSSSMSGPAQELINFSVKVQGTNLTSYALGFQGGFITAPGAVYGLWDDLTGEDGSTTRSFCVTFGESEVVVEGSGEETVEEDEDGTLTITRAEDCTVSMDEEEIGTLTIRSVLVVSGNTAK